MEKSKDIRRYRKNLNSELDAVYLYDRLASLEKNSSLAEVYRRLAQTEAVHAATWEAKLRDAGAEATTYSPGWRTRMLCFLAARFGVSFVLPAIAGIEQGARSHYDGQPEPEAAMMSAQERTHAHIFKHLARTTSGIDGSAVARIEGRHRASGGNALRAGVLGANDGLVSVFCLVMGVAGAGVGSREILLTGFAGLLAGALSMALGEWLSVKSSRELYEHQMDIEEQELAENPEEEMEELALIYQAKGMAAHEARSMAGKLLEDRNAALDTLAREELGIDPGELGGSAWEAAITSFVLFAVGAVIPVCPYFLFTGSAGIIASAVFSTFGLFVIGAAITLMTGRSALHSGMRQVAFGLAAAAVTFGLGHLIGVGLG